MSFFKFYQVFFSVYLLDWIGRIGDGSNERSTIANVRFLTPYSSSSIDG